MFSRLLQSASSVFSKPSNPPEKTESDHSHSPPRTDTSIAKESTRSATNSNMATTRRRSRADEVTAMKAVAAESPMTSDRKRKVDVSDSPPSDAKKRPRKYVKKVKNAKNGELLEHPKQGGASVGTSKTIKRTRMSEITVDDLITSARPSTPIQGLAHAVMEPESAQSKKSWIEVVPGQMPVKRPAVAVVIESKKRTGLVLQQVIAGKGRETTESTSQTVEHLGEQEVVKKRKVGRPRKAAKDFFHGDVEDKTSGPSGVISDLAKSEPKPKTSHVRFGSEDAPPNPGLVDASEKDLEEKVAEITLPGSESFGVESEDEAPETQSLDAGRAKAKALALVAAKAKER